jgi:hypothetical protein
MYALSADPDRPGAPVLFSVDTVAKLNHNLYSITEAFEQQGFDIHLKHHGFSGLIKTDENGNETRIPAHYDWDSHQWLLHVVVAADYDTAHTAGTQAEQQIGQYINCNNADASHVVYMTLHEQISEIIERRGVLTMRHDDVITSIDVDALIGLADALDTAEAADDDESKDSALELVQDQLVEFDSTVGCSKNAHARGRHMTDLQWHVHTGHVGYHPQCDICRTVKASLRRSYKTVDPYHEERPGYTWSADTITWSSRSRYGCKYTTVFRDHASKVYKLIHSWLRSDLCSQIEALILELRANPLYTEGKSYKIMTILKLDPAGEWNDRNKEWNAMCKRTGLICQYSSPDEKRSLKENSVKQMEIGTKAIMAERNLPVDWWQDAADQACELRGLVPVTKAIVNADGDAIRPEEHLSNGRISRKECDRRLHYFVLVGTPAMVTINNTKVSNIDQINRVRWGIAVKMINGDLPLFMDPHTGSTFRSRAYRLFEMKPGESAWSFCGAEPPRLPQTARRRPSDDNEDLDRVIDLDAFALVRKDGDHGSPGAYLQAQVADRDQQRYEPGDDDYLRAVSEGKGPLKDDSEPDETKPIDDSVKITQDLDALSEIPPLWVATCSRVFHHRTAFIMAL